MVTLTTATLADDVKPTATPKFPQGTNAFSLDVSYPALIDPTIMPTAHVGLQRFVFDNFSLGAEIITIAVVQPGDDAAAIGLIGTVRHHVIQTESTSWFIDFGFGPVQASNRVPEGGTRFNFITRIGPAVAIELNERVSLVTAARYWHLSNARIEGSDRNPSLNACELSIGLMWRW